MKDRFAALSDEGREKLRRRKQPAWTKPMLATLTHDPFSDKAWFYERKFDGERCLAFRTGRKIALRSRNRKSLNATYPELVDALARQTCDDFILDGEVVAFEQGVTSFSRLQQRMQIKRRKEARQSHVSVYYYLFDLLYADGRDATGLTLRNRKRLLKRAIAFEDPLRFTTHRVADGVKYFQQACHKGWEGVIAKKADSPYQHSRSRDWLKFKCQHQQEFVVGGFTDPEGSRIGFGALLLGYYDNEDLLYAGMVGTGFDDDLLERLKQRLTRLERKTPAFAREDRLPGKHIHWVSPKLVAQVAFTEWTDGKLRHPRFLGLRRDKDPGKVTRETPKG